MNLVVKTTTQYAFLQRRRVAADIISGRVSTRSICSAVQALYSATFRCSGLKFLPKLLSEIVLNARGPPLHTGQTEAASATFKCAEAAAASGP